jgi:hypothetical protein
MEMAFRIEKRSSALVTGLVLLASASFGQQEFRYQARFVNSELGHAKTAGALSLTASGISFDETREDGKKPKHPRVWHWDYQDIQQLKIAAKSLTVLTYQDNRWKLGADRSYEFQIVSDGTFETAYEFLRTRLDQRFVAEIPDHVSNALWEMPVKHLLPFGGDPGVLQVGEDKIVYKSAAEDKSRTWRYEDIDNISSSGPFQLTITTFERARMHYGSRKIFNFELKQPLDDARYDGLWLRLNQSKGLKVLTGYREE